jgi:hypothetical protein
VLVGDEVTFAAFSFLFNFHVVQVDRLGTAGRSTFKYGFSGADYLLAKLKSDSYLGRITHAEMIYPRTYISHFGTRNNMST